MSMRYIGWLQYQPGVTYLQWPMEIIYSVKIQFHVLTLVQHCLNVSIFEYLHKMVHLIDRQTQLDSLDNIDIQHETQQT